MFKLLNIVFIATLLCGFYSCSKEVLITDFEKEFNSLVTAKASNEIFINFLREIPPDEKTLSQKLINDFTTFKVNQFTSIENSLINNNELENRDVPCFKEYSVECLRAGAQFWLDLVLGFDSYAGEVCLERLEKAEEKFYKCLDDKYGKG